MCCNFFQALEGFKKKYFYLEGIKGELDLITKHVCNEAPNAAECEEQLPAFWGAIAVSLFNPENGWFSADNICMVSFTKVI